MDGKIRNKWVAWLFGGNFSQEPVCGGYGWNPGLYHMVRRYYREGWNRNGYSLWRFIEPFHLQQKRAGGIRREND